jgi:uncharacterized lipoprotein YmbA
VVTGRSPAITSVLLLAAGLGCLKPSPPVVYHTLQPLRLAEAPARHSTLALEVLPVRLPELLRRPQMVVAQGRGDLGLSETQHWGNPLDLDMQRVLVADLTLLLGSDAVVASPDGPRVAARYRLEVQVQSCDGSAGDGLTLQAAWMVTRSGVDQAVLFRRTVLREPMGPGPDALEAAHSRILAALAREIAVELERLP